MKSIFKLNATQWGSVMAFLKQLPSASSYAIFRQIVISHGKIKYQLISILTQYIGYKGISKGYHDKYPFFCTNRRHKYR